jgi:phosphoglycerate kinase
MTAFKTLDDLQARGKRVLLRVDLNVPMADGKVTDTTRIERVTSTIRDLSEAGAHVIMLAHFGRPKGKRNEAMSLAPVADAVAKTIDKPVGFVDDCIGETAAKAIKSMQDGDILLLENTRFYSGEEGNDPDFAKALAANGDIYVNDAFSVSHRAHATSEGLAHHLPAYAGRAMEKELKALESALGSPKHPVVAVVGGAKVSTKLALLGNLIDKVDVLIIGGGMANTFLAAQGLPVGKSLCEHDLVGTAKEIIEAAKDKNCEILLPQDVVVASEFKAHAPSKTIPVQAVGDEDMILDVGSNTLAEIAIRFEGANTIVWNGPLGAFEIEPFNNGTNVAARHVAMLTQANRVTSVAGGGDTLAALNQANVANDFSYVSTAGGAFLEWLEGKELPGVKALT